MIPTWHGEGLKHSTDDPHTSRTRRTHHDALNTTRAKRTLRAHAPRCAYVSPCVAHCRSLLEETCGKPRAGGSDSKEIARGVPATAVMMHVQSEHAVRRPSTPLLGAMGAPEVRHALQGRWQGCRARWDGSGVRWTESHLYAGSSSAISCR